MKRLILLGALCLPAFLAGCIHNDLPYPVVPINIEAIEAEGLDGAAQINAAQQTVILPLLETTDIRNVHITSVTLTEGGQSSVRRSPRPVTSSPSARAATHPNSPT